MDPLRPDVGLHPLRPGGCVRRWQNILQHHAVALLS